jgi:hypothetical protein
MEILSVEKTLNHLDVQIRREAILSIRKMIEEGALTPPPPQENCNLHVHTFFSYNAFGHSPSSLAWLARREGIKLMGIIDFDTLEGTEEFLWACEQLQVRGTVSLETRVYLPEFADLVITSKGHPGIAYYILSGFASGGLSAPAQTKYAEVKSYLTSRNLRIVQTLNNYLSPLAVDYAVDVVSLTAGETPTERHIMQAYYQSAINTLDNPVTFWSAKLGLDIAEVERLHPQPAVFRRIMREKLIKNGDIAYQTPGPVNYPTLEMVNELAHLTDSLPTLVWANGTYPAEREESTLLDYLWQNGLVGLNIVPDRSINVPEADKDFRLKCLCEIVDLAAQFDLPIFIGTEMNQPGHAFVDDLNSPVLTPFKQTFMNGAYFLYGHTLLARHANLGYLSAWSQDQFTNRRSRIDFYTKAGFRLPNTTESRDFLQSLPLDLSARDFSGLLDKQFPNPN